MEFKVRQESHTLLEKMFAANAKQGIVSAEIVPGLLREFNTDINVVTEDLTEVTSDYEAGLDWDHFEKVMIHYLVKQSRKESNEFGHKNVISLADFDSP